MSGSAPNMAPALTQREVDTFVIDSREVRAGNVFFALSQPEYKNNGFNGDFEDSTKYVEAALRSGATACVLRPDRYKEHTSLEKYSDRLIFSDDVIASLQGLAHGVYKEWNGSVVAITGSAGKTTAKELTAEVLGFAGKKVLKNIKNYNNGLGHPLTVLNLAKDPGYDAAVLEMGMSTPLHEIERLCRITPPDVSVVLNVLPVHLEHLGSIENIAAAKAEIVAGMKPGGTAVLNFDDARVAQMADLSSGKVITFGFGDGANVTAANVVSKGFGMTEFTLSCPDGIANVRFHLSGRHNILNALAAAAVGTVFGISVEVIAGALANAAPPPQRGEVLRFRDGFVVLNDSYNSNPDALISMTQTLLEGSPKGSRKIVVAGEMLELGPDTERIHFETGRTLASLGIDELIGVRGNGESLVAGAVSAGIDSAQFATDSDAAAKMLVSMIKSGDAILVKGSRGVRTERVVDELLANFELEGEAAANVR
ncbi:MAG: UDP-N-acetylmuramoyl-tripeptide--D-alanyl-D-alanine ligase [Acidobacteria bacterium]|nr:UDP-N-acetylmuramoyl-tripeptide--D-alanyl-D-alanine ligase [Acidobacteriota bacterium]